MIIASRRSTSRPVVSQVIAPILFLHVDDILGPYQPVLQSLVLTLQALGLGCLRIRFAPALLTQVACLAVPTPLRQMRCVETFPSQQRNLCSRPRAGASIYLTVETVV
jgi:hypothetical protein